MALEFNITGAPPLLDDIIAERDQATIDRASLRKKNIPFLICFISVLGIYLTLMIMYVIPHMNDPEFGITTYFLPYLTFVIFVVGNNLHLKTIEKPGKALEATIAALNEAPPEKLTEIASAGEHPVEVSSYLDQIAAQDRSPVQAEIDALRQWLDGRKTAS